MFYTEIFDVKSFVFWSLYGEQPFDCLISNYFLHIYSIVVIKIVRARPSKSRMRVNTRFFKKKEKSAANTLPLGARSAMKKV